MASYPGAPVIFPARADATTIFAAHMNAVQDEIAAIEASLLGTIPHPLALAQSLTLSAQIAPPQITADQNDYNPAGLATTLRLRLLSDAARTITGFVAQPAGRLLMVTNAGTFTITLAHDNAASSANNRILCPGGSAYEIAANASAWIYYDALGRWFVVESAGGGAGGGPTTQTYVPVWTASGGAAPNFGNAAVAGRYWRTGKLVFFFIRILFGSTSTFGTAGNAWRFTTPSPMQQADQNGAITFAWLQDFGTTNHLALSFVVGSNTFGLFANASASQVGTTVPFTWVANDGITIQGWYWEA